MPKHHSNFRVILHVDYSIPGTDILDKLVGRDVALNYTTYSKILPFGILFTKTIFMITDRALHESLVYSGYDFSYLGFTEG